MSDFKTISQVNEAVLLIKQQETPLLVPSRCDFVIKTKSFDCIL